MPAIDHCEAAIINAFVKAGWQITEHPFFMRSSTERGLFADFKAERLEGDKIEQVVIVEVKCFPESGSILEEFYRAVGQYLCYFAALKLRNLADALHLAMPNKVYYEVIARELAIVPVQNIKIIIFDIENEEIEAWIT